MVDRRTWLGRCKLGGCCFEEEHPGECNDGNMSDQEYEVECITAEKLVRKKRVYRVKWRGWPEEDSTWEKESSLADAKECLDEWKQTKRLKKTAMAAPEETKLAAATEVEVTEAEEKEVVVLTYTEAEETEAEEAEAEETEPVSQEEVEAPAAADARAAAIEPQVIPSPVGTLSELQADADVWLSVLEEVALLREGVPPKRTYDEPNFVAHTLPFQALQLISQVCKAWRIDEATNARIWKALFERRWPSAVQMEAPCNHRALFKTLSQPLGRFKSALDQDYMPYGPNVFGKKPIKFDPEMRELQKGFHATFKELKKSKQVDYFLMGGTLADVTLLVDIHSIGGAHLISQGLRGPPTVRLTYKDPYDFSFGGPPRPEPREVCLWTFVTPLPPGWHKVEKKVSCSLVNARLGKARLILDRQTESERWYDMTKSTDENAQEPERFKKSYGGTGMDVPELECSDECGSYPLLNIEEANGNLTISLYAVGANQAASDYPLGLVSWLEPIRQSGLAPADPRRLPTLPSYLDPYSGY